MSQQGFSQHEELAQRREMEQHVPIPVERPYVPDLAVSMLAEPEAKRHMKKELLRVAKESAPGARLEDDAAELLLYVADNFLSGLANFTCRLANHRGSNSIDVKDMEMYLEQVHGIRIPLTNIPPEDPAKPEGKSRPETENAPAPIRGASTRGIPRSLAQARPRRYTNPPPPENPADEDEDEDGDDDDDEEGTGEEDESDSEDEKPRESKRLKERALAAEKDVKQRRRGKVGRPRK